MLDAVYNVIVSAFELAYPRKPPRETYILATSVKTLADELAKLALNVRSLYEQVYTHKQAIINIQQFNANLVRAMSERKDVTHLPDINGRTPEKPN